MLEKVTSEKLCRSCDPSELSFKTTEDIPSLEETIGQERALRSLDFGVEIDDIGFNIYILGESGTGKMTTIKNMLEKKSKDRPVPNDWCYVYNFDNPDEPSALSLPPGMGLTLQKDMDELVKALKLRSMKSNELASLRIFKKSKKTSSWRLKKKQKKKIFH
jgi:hypothetical protein